MSGAADPAAGQVTPPRARILSLLETERMHAANAFEATRVAEIDAQIARISAAGTPQSPVRETTSRTPAASRRKR